MAPPSSRAIRERVLRALLRARTPGFHFPGYFLGVEWQSVAPECSRMSLPGGPHLVDAKGDVDLLALCLLADIAFGTAMRSADQTTERLSTLYLQLQFTGLQARGDVRAEARLVHTAADTELEQRLATAMLSGSEGPLCHGTSTFVRLATPPDVTLGPLPWQAMDAPSDAGLDEADATDAERDAIRRCDEQLAAGGAGFLAPFLLGPAPTDERAFDVATGAHTRNRVGHVQGGLLLGIAARAGSAAAPAHMRLANVSAWYVSPGRGRLRVRADVVHHGRNTALVHATIETDAGDTVLRTVSQHVALASAA